MARRKDGSARRYEFQIFDNPQGRAIFQALSHVHQSGGSVADFIREALLFYIEYQQRAPESPTPMVQQEINALWKALAHTSRNAPVADESPGMVMGSSGLDVTSRRGSPRARAVDQEAPPPAAFDRRDAQQRLLATIKQFSQNRAAVRG